LLAVESDERREEKRIRAKENKQRRVDIAAEQFKKTIEVGVDFVSTLDLDRDNY
jgi:hypothetical protein